MGRRERTSISFKLPASVSMERRWMSAGTCCNSTVFPPVLTAAYKTAESNLFLCMRRGEESPCAEPLMLQKEVARWPVHKRTLDMLARTRNTRTRRASKWALWLQWELGSAVREIPAALRQVLAPCRCYLSPWSMQLQWEITARVEHPRPDTHVDK